MPGTLNNKLLPFAEQLAALRKRTANLVPTQRWTDMQRNAHTTAFTVAGAMKADLLKDLAQAVEDSIAKGLGIDYFRKQFDTIVAKHGWQYNGERNWRIRVIYQTNMSTSYAAGRLSQLRSPELQKLKPFWMYRHSDSVLYPRPLHVSWDGLVLPADHAWFKTHYPPNGWGCHCRIVAVSEAEAKRRGKAFAPPDDGTAPDGTPKGIDPGWDYMPGDTESSAAHNKALIEDKAAALPEPLQAAMRMQPTDISQIAETQFDAAGALRVAVEQQANDAFQAALDAVQRVHKFPAIKPIKIVPELNPALRGEYDPYKRQLSIARQSDNIHPNFVAVHELGHLFDEEFIGLRLGKTPNDVMSVLSIIRQSARYKALLAYTANQERRTYLLQDHETFARAYSQYIALRSAEATLLEAVAYHANHVKPKFNLWHWTDADFAAIARALDRLFERRRLR